MLRRRRRSSGDNDSNSCAVLGNNAASATFSRPKTATRVTRNDEHGSSNNKGKKIAARTMGRKRATASVYNLSVIGFFIVCAGTGRGTAPVFCSAETEVKWTPNPDDQQGQGPLPLSQNQRNQLMQLEQAIRNSPDPQATLVKAAEANQMDPQDLVDLLNRNRNDMMMAQGGASGGGGGTLVVRNAVGKAVTSVTVLLGHVARKHPRSLGLFILLALLVAYASIAAPRTGLELSSRRNALLGSKGPTTVWDPPTAFVQRRFLSSDDSFSRQWTDSEKKTKKMKEGEEASDWRQLVPVLSGDSDDDSSTQWLTRSQLKKQHDLPNLQQVATAQATLSVRDFLNRRGPERQKPVGDEEDAEEGANDEQEEQIVAEIMDLMLDHASDVLLSSRQLTELGSAQENGVRLVVPDDDGEGDDESSKRGKKSRRQNRTVLVVRGMGDWNRYGLLPLRITSQLETDRQLAMTLDTLYGLGRWDGQIHVTISRTDDDTLRVGVILAVPKGSNKITKPIALRIVESLCDSIRASVTTRTRQSLARRSQSARFQGKARRFANKRRAERFQKEREMEEMATDRRRRWQRSNPNAGSYRPSGDRMRSPNNAVYH